jgi:hypothetical protein
LTRRRRRSKLKKVINFYLKNMSNEAPSSSVADKLRRMGRELVNRITGRDLLSKAEEEREKAHKNWLMAQGELLFAKNMGDPKTVAVIGKNLDDLCQTMMLSTTGKKGTMKMLKATETILYIEQGFYEAAKKAYQNPAGQETADPQQP